MNKKISMKIYKEIKKDYLDKKSMLSVIYRKYHKTHNIDKIQFKKIIEQIKIEENIPQKSGRKVKRTFNHFSFYDKHPDSYLESSYMVS